jgi:hypothetical protein
VLRGRRRVQRQAPSRFPRTSSLLGLEPVTLRMIDGRARWSSS